MPVIWISFLVVLGWAIALVRSRSRIPGRYFIGILALAGGTVAAAYHFSAKEASLEQAKRVQTEATPMGDRGEGYAHSETCVSCHPREHQTWFKSFHRTMTQVSSPETVLGDFNHVELDLAGAKYNLSREGDQFFVEMDDPFGRGRTSIGEKTPLARVRLQTGLLTGSHHMQVAWVSPGPGKMQLLLPFAWLIPEKRWVPFDQTFLRDPATPYSPQVWNQNCAACHSTAPRPLFEPTKGSVRTTAGELGIACEACHGPGEEHIRYHHNPARRYATRFASEKSAPPGARLVNPAKLDSKRAADVCGQCHSINWYRNFDIWNRDGIDFKPGMDLQQSVDTVRPAQKANQEWVKSLRQNPRFVSDRYWSDGMARVSGREFNGLIESPCYKKGELTCISCHSLHDSDPDDQLKKGMDGNHACLQCHTKMAASVEAHTHHRADSSGSLCYNCHMPFTTYGLLKGIRSHQITSPNIAVARDTGRPDACTACHLDKSPGWAATYLGKWFGQKIPTLTADENELPAAAMRALKGDAGIRALTAHAFGWREAQAVSGTNWYAPYLGQLMDDPYPAVRYIAHRSLKTLPQYKDFAFDFTIAPTARKPALPEPVPDGDAKINAAKFTELLNARDNQSMDLQE